MQEMATLLGSHSVIASAIQKRLLNCS